MATCLDIITRAMQLSGILGVGKTPKAAESDLGMDCLQSFYDVLLANGMFGRLEDVYLDGNDTAQEGKRYYIASGVTLTAPTNAVIDSNGDTRQPRDLACYESYDGTTRTVKVYDRTGWVSLTGLTTTDTAPLSGRGQMGLAAALACDGAFIAAFGGEPPPRVQKLAANFMAGLSYKIGSTQDRRQAEYY